MPARPGVRAFERLTRLPQRLSPLSTAPRGAAWPWARRRRPHRRGGELRGAHARLACRRRMRTAGAPPRSLPVARLRADAHGRASRSGGDRMVGSSLVAARLRIGVRSPRNRRQRAPSACACPGRGVTTCRPDLRSATPGEPPQGCGALTGDVDERCRLRESAAVFELMLNRGHGDGPAGRSAVAASASPSRSSRGAGRNRAPAGDPPFAPSAERQRLEEACSISGASRAIPSVPSPGRASAFHADPPRDPIPAQALPHGDARLAAQACSFSGIGWVPALPRMAIQRRPGLVQPRWARGKR